MQQFPFRVVFNNHEGAFGICNSTLRATAVLVPNGSIPKRSVLRTCQRSQNACGGRSGMADECDSCQSVSRGKSHKAPRRTHDITMSLRSDLEPDSSLFGKGISRWLFERFVSTHAPCSFSWRRTGTLPQPSKKSSTLFLAVPRSYTHVFRGVFRSELCVFVLSGEVALVRALDKIAWLSVENILL